MAKVKEKAKAKVKAVLPVRVRQRCDDCGLRIRGENHAEGIHHKSGGRGKFQRKYR